jgi:hypothetical protein
MSQEEPDPLKINVDDSPEGGLREALGMHKAGPDSEELVVLEPEWQARGGSERGEIGNALSQGAPSEGEADSLACAGRFIRFLREQGEEWWEDPVTIAASDRPWLDCEALDRRDRRPPIMRTRTLMQVQRAMIGNERYSEWESSGKIELPHAATPQAAAELLMEAIRNKRSKAASDVVLLLDAARFPWLALQEVVIEFRGLYELSDIKGLFQALYIVPWHESAIRRLDS